MTDFGAELRPMSGVVAVGRRSRVARAVAGAASLLLVLSAVPPRAVAADSPVRAVRGTEDRASAWPLARLVKREWGIEVAWVRRLAAGQMLEFRYRVVDAEKAKELFVRRQKPWLIDEATGLRLKVASFATTGEMRNSNLPKPGRIYWMLFPNPGRRVQQGSRVTIEIGDFAASGLKVR